MTLFEKGYGPKRLLLYVLILLWHLCPNIASAAPNDDYKVLVKRASNMNVFEIADLADSAHNAGDDRKAMALYMSVCNSQDINLTEDNMTALVRASARSRRHPFQPRKLCRRAEDVYPESQGQRLLRLTSLRSTFI